MEQNNNNPNLLNVHDVLAVSDVNGPGLRAVVWVQGCSRRCSGCSNPLTHSHRPHVLFAPERLAESILTISGIEGVTVTGGEPCEQALAVGRLCLEVRKKGLSVVLYTGWKYEDICHSENQAVRGLLEQIDILIDGPFVRHLADKNLVWRGSSNQQVYFLTDRYSADILQNNGQAQVEGVLTQGATDMIVTGFPDDFDITVLAGRLAVEAGIVLEPVEDIKNHNSNDEVKL